jgi:isocitrate dehydrogenase (NAD+)
VVLVIQNTEGLYASVEWGAVPEGLRAQLDRHPSMASFSDVPSSELALSCRLFSRGACARVAEAAFAYARSHGYGSVTVCDKWGVMRETSAMLLAEVRAVAARYPDVELRLTFADSQVLALTRQPERFDVIVTSSLLGDLLSDGFAGQVGGLGFAPCANLGPSCAVFEPVHGSAPKYAELDPPLVNPCAAILAAAMLLEHCGHQERARAVREAVGRIVREGAVRTFDLAGLPGGPEAVARGAATTAQMTDAILAALPPSPGV